MKFLFQKSKINFCFDNTFDSAHKQEFLNSPHAPVRQEEGKKKKKKKSNKQEEISSVVQQARDNTPDL